MEKLYTKIGLNIKSARQSKIPPVSQLTLGKKVGLSRTSIVNIEKGKHRIHVHTLYQIANSLEISPNSLLPEISENKSIKIASHSEIDKKTKMKLEKLISEYDNKEVKLIE